MSVPQEARMRPRPVSLHDPREFPILYVDDEAENLRNTRKTHENGKTQNGKQMKFNMFSLTLIPIGGLFVFIDT